MRSAITAVVGASVLCLAAVGCGSTVATTTAGTEAGPGGSAGAGLTLPAGTTGAAGSAAGLGSGPAVGTAAGSIGSESATGRSATARAAGLPESTAGSQRRSDSTDPLATPIEVGFQISDNAAVAYKAVGVAQTPLDEEAAVGALVSWTNGHGGIDGHRLVAVVHKTDPESGSFASQQESACVDFTEDHHVLATVPSPSVGGRDELVACLAKHRTIDLEENRWVFDTADYNRYAPYLYRPADINPDRWGAAYLDRLAARGFFSGSARVGLARFDSPVFGRVASDVIKPELQRLHANLVSEAVIGEPASVADFGAMGSEISSAIVKFRAEGVDRVLFLQNAGELTFFWMPQAQSQGYTPRYGFNESDVFGLATQYPQALAGGALAVGWLPGNDVSDRDRPSGNTAFTLCRHIMVQGRVPNISGNAFDYGAFCDGVFFLRAVFAQSTPADAVQFASVVHRSLGSSYVSPLNFGPTMFSGGRFDGGADVADLTYFSNCTCFRYISSPHAVP